MMIVFSLGLFLLAGSAAAGNREDVKPVDAKLYDLELVDQDGQKVRFRSDVVGDRVVAVIPFYTTCTTAYPILIHTFSRLQNLVGERLGKEVILVSITIDPRTDIPFRLKTYAHRQKAKPGWLFLTGERSALAKTLLGVGILPSLNLDLHNHSPLTVVGGAGKDWKRFNGYASPEFLRSHIETLLVSGGVRMK